MLSFVKNLRSSAEITSFKQVHWFPKLLNAIRKEVEFLRGSNRVIARQSG